MSSARILPDLNTLVALFYSDPHELGQFTEVSADEMPDTPRQLLAHDHHMTVTVEKYHDSPVDVRVLDTIKNGSKYARKILLARQSDGLVVQFGIMRVNFAYLDDEVCREIESRRLPLGRILIQHNVHREVHLRSLWRVEPGDDLRQLFPPMTADHAYGRTAMIYCNEEPAIELLEIVPTLDA